MNHSVESLTKNTRPVKCLDDGVIHKSLRRAAEFYGIDRTCINDVCNGVRFETQGKRFEYVGKGEAMKSGVILPKETEEQKLVMEWASWNLRRYPDLKWLIHVPLGEYRHKKTAGLLKAMGVKKGFPDIMLPTSRRGYHALVIELKRQKGAKPSTSPEQKEWIAYLETQGWCAAVCYGADEAIKKLEWYLGK
jgi:hypothetical protein